MCQNITLASIRTRIPLFVRVSSAVLLVFGIASLVLGILVAQQIPQIHSVVSAFDGHMTAKLSNGKIEGALIAGTGGLFILMAVVCFALSFKEMKPGCTLITGFYLGFTKTISILTILMDIGAKDVDGYAFGNVYVYCTLCPSLFSDAQCTVMNYNGCWYRQSYVTMENLFSAASSISGTGVAICIGMVIWGALACVKPQVIPPTTQVIFVEGGQFQQQNIYGNQGAASFNVYPAYQGQPSHPGLLAAGAPTYPIYPAAPAAQSNVAYPPNTTVTGYPVVNEK